MLLTRGSYCVMNKRLFICFWLAKLTDGVHNYVVALIRLYPSYPKGLSL